MTRRGSWLAVFAIGGIALGVGRAAGQSPRQGQRESPREGQRQGQRETPREAGPRVEDDSPALTWTGAWSRNGLAANSGGSARLAMDAGAEVRFAFSGTSASWIGYRDEWCGIARVFVDGELQATVDTYASPAEAQATLYTVSGLGRGNHTLTIHATGTKSAASAGAWIWVDAFAVAPAGGSATSPANLVPSRPFSAGADRERGSPRDQRHESSLRREQEDPSVTWKGAWSTNRQAAHSGGSARLSMEPSARATFVFSGTGVSWIGYRDQWSGIADVLLDGRFQTSVDTYSGSAKSQAGLYTIDGLPNGTHTLTIQPTGRHRPAAAGAWIWVDGFSVMR